MEEFDTWSVLSARFEEETLQTFAEFVEQIELVLQLLDDGARSRVRTALTELHSLADILLYRHAQAVFRAVEGGTYCHHAMAYTQPERRKLERSFSKRVELATKPVEGLFVGPIAPLLDESDAEVFRIAHAYRNPAYHRGEQNAATLPLVARAFLGALTRAWVRSQPPVGLERRRWEVAGAERIAELDTEESYVRLDHAAEHIGARLIAASHVSLEEAREVLAADLMVRARAVEATVDDLEREGLSRKRVAEGLSMSEAGARLEQDPHMVELERERRDLARKLVARLEAGRTAKKLMRAHAELQEEIAGRFFAAVRDHKARLSLRTAERIPRQVAAMRRLKTQTALLRRYRQLDEQLEPVERRLWEGAIAWEEHVQQEVDRYREEKALARYEPPTA